jgi:hypothetical protein
VIGIEHISGLAEQSRENLGKDGVKLGNGADGGSVEIICGDGRLGGRCLRVFTDNRLSGTRLVQVSLVGMRATLTISAFQGDPCGSGGSYNSSSSCRPGELAPMLVAFSQDAEIAACQTREDVYTRWRR